LKWCKSDTDPLSLKLEKDTGFLHKSVCDGNSWYVFVNSLILGGIMKFLSIICIAGMFTGTAYSKVITDVELTYSIVNGSVAPQYRVRTICTIAKGSVTKVTTKAFKEGKPSVKKIKWTGLVADQEELGLLLSDAASGKIKTHHAPLGGRFENYNGSFKATTSSKLKEVHLKSTRDLNISNEAKTLIEFLDTNCK
jgi:hypothetical protein